MDYAQISKETISLLHKSYNSLKNSPLNQQLIVLIELRVSQINGCTYCCQIHSEEAKKLQIPLEKLNALTTWQTSSLFSKEEKITLHWAEALTHLDHDLDKIKEELTKSYTEREVVDLTACISIMNALNRLAISLR